MGDYYFELKNVMEEIGERDNIDTFIGRAYQGGVRGFYTYMEGMAIFGKEGEVWAIYLKDNEIRYFTNVMNWKTVIPKTFLHWMSRFNDTVVIYYGDAIKPR